MSLKGSPELKRRLKAIGLVFKPVGRRWADITVVEMRRRIPKKTGHTAASIRRKNATQRRATVVGSFVTNFIDAGVKAHDVTAKGKTLHGFAGRGGNTIFAKKVHKARIAPRRFKRASAEEALRQNPMAIELTKLWNEAA